MTHIFRELWLEDIRPMFNSKNNETKNRKEKVKRNRKSKQIIRVTIKVSRQVKRAYLVKKRNIDK